EFNSFHIIWKDVSNRIHKESLNPYSTTFKQGIQYVKDKLQMSAHFINGTDELIIFECKFDKCKPALLSNMNNPDISLHDIYKYLPHYPIIQVHWEIFETSMVPYKRTIYIQRNNLSKSVPIQNIVISSNEKPTFNPLLYECDLHKLKVIQDAVHSKVSRNYELRGLLYEMIKNVSHKNIKKQINYNEKNPNKLILNEKILTILNELKILYHDDIHKQMGYSLQLWHIC
ncbi:hypothetical protein RFI_38840, partial [Reticulomyxa filosa]